MLDLLLGLIRGYGFFVGLTVAFLDSVGAPLVTLPILVVAGALAQAGHHNVLFTLSGVVLGAVAADLIWFFLGRRHGRPILALLCRVALNPDACVDRAEEAFRRRHRSTILFSRFLPGVTVVMPPLAGITAVPLVTFLGLDLLGVTGFGAVGAGLGWAFGATVVGEAQALQGSLQLLLPVGFVGYLAWRIGDRRRLVRRYRAPRISAQELFARLSSEDKPLVLDVRSDAAYAAAAAAIPGSIRIRPAKFERDVVQLPADRELVFYCA